MSSEKPTNPKDACGIKKAPLSVVSSPALMEAGLGMLEGALKYGRHNYRAIGVRGSVYYDATLRHLVAWWEGEDLDPDSGLSHVTKAICSLLVLRDAMIVDKFTDDRPPRAPAGWLAELNAKAAALIEKYPNPVPAYIHEEPAQELQWIVTVDGRAEYRCATDECLCVGRNDIDPAGCVHYRGPYEPAPGTRVCARCGALPGAFHKTGCPAVPFLTNPRHPG